MGLLIGLAFVVFVIAVVALVTRTESPSAGLDDHGDFADRSLNQNTKSYGKNKLARFDPDDLGDAPFRWWHFAILILVLPWTVVRLLWWRCFSPQSETASDAIADRGANIPEYPGAYDHLVNRGPLTGLLNKDTAIQARKALK
jgi:hypothetical protein